MTFKWSLSNLFKCKEYILKAKERERNRKANDVQIYLNVLWLDLYIQKKNVMGAYEKLSHLLLTRMNAFLTLHNPNVASRHETAQWYEQHTYFYVFVSHKHAQIADAHWVFLRVFKVIERQEKSSHFPPFVYFTALKNNVLYKIVVA